MTADVRVGGSLQFLIAFEFVSVITLKSVMKMMNFRLHQMHEMWHLAVDDPIAWASVCLSFCL